MPFDIANSVGSGAVGSIFGILNTGMQNMQQERLTQMQVDAQKKLTDYNMQKQLEMWEKTGYGAQVDQMNKAGINPALLYGKSGGGGQTAQIAQGNVSGGTAQRPNEIMGMMQMQNMETERKVLESQAKKNNAEADAISGVHTREAETRILSLTQGIKNQQAAEELTKAETALKRNELMFNEDTFNDRSDSIKYNMENAMELANQARYKTDIDRNTYKDIIKKIKAESIGAEIMNGLYTAQIENVKGQTALNAAQKEKVWSDIQKNTAEIYKMAADITQRGQEIGIKEFAEEIKANYPSIFNAMGNLWLNSVDAMKDILGENKNVRDDRPVKRYR